MVKKKFSGQTIAIIILSILLLIAIGFGAVYAFYSARSNRVSGEITMARLEIDLLVGDVQGNGQSGMLQIEIRNNENVVPGQSDLENTPLTVSNNSSVDIYIVVVYNLTATIDDSIIVEDKFENPVLGLGCEYINTKDSKYNIQKVSEVTNSHWIDYVFYGEEELKYYRCMVSKHTVDKKGGENDSVAVIEQNQFALHRLMGNEYMNSSIKVIFQAYAIGAATFKFNESHNNEAKCQQIVSAIYESQDHSFLK